MGVQKLLLVFPHQLFEQHPGLEHQPDLVLLLEDSLFFGDRQYPLSMHKQKLWLHRATMKRYESKLQSDGHNVRYLEYTQTEAGLIRVLRAELEQLGAVQELIVCDPTDFVLEKRIRKFVEEADVKLTWLDNPSFLNSPSQNAEYRAGKKRWFMADYYKAQRKRLDVLMDGGEPVGGKWSYDAENRKKVPKRLQDSVPAIPTIKRDAIDSAAADYVNENFSMNLGSLEQLYYPTSHETAKAWLKAFLKFRLSDFGAYEDAMLQGQEWLWHSVLTPTLNIGLLTPQQVLEETLLHIQQHETPLNSSEGFIRQIIGWREFMRATYQDLGVTMRTTNHWHHHRSIPDSFWNATTGIAPIDDTISRILKTGYCHHIERLMVLGGFMFLCEFDPDEIYRWFMEMFIDSYDWVMVSNVYAMSQNADGGSITTKPYFSGSAYIRKMSNHATGPWCEIWDGLYWRWIWNHVDELARNPRWSMMCAMIKKMDEAKRQSHLNVANEFLGEIAPAPV